MDPTVQTNTTSSSTTKPTPAQTQGDQVIVSGAFGGTIPSTQEAISETMPSFSFDEAEFWGPVEPLPSTQNELIADPFAWWAASTNFSLDDLEPTLHAPVVSTEASNNELWDNTNPPSDTGDSTVSTSPNSESNSNSNEEINTWIESNNNSLPTFDIPSPIENVEQTPTATPQNESIADISFDLPTQTLDESTENTASFNIEESSGDLSSETTTVTVSQGSQQVSQLTPDITATPIAEVEVPVFDIPSKENTSTDISFDLPNMDTTSIADTTPSTEINEISTSEVATELVGDQNTIVTQSSDQPQDILTPPVSQSQDTVTEDISHNSFNIPSEENNDEVRTPIEVTPSNTEEPSELTEEESKSHQELQEEHNSEDIQDKEPDDTAINEENNEVYADNSHELQESFEEFNTALTNYLTFLDTNSITITGLRTENNEVNYEFSKEYDNTISIEKSNTGDTIAFVPTESGLEVLLNNESIAYYGVNKVSNDTTHYLKEKLGKFTMMISSDHEKQEKAKKDEAKKIKETLRNF